MEKTVLGITTTLKSALGAATVGDSIPVPDSSTPVKLLRKPTAAEVARFRRQFLKLAKTHPNDGDTASIGRMYVNYINKCLE